MAGFFTWLWDWLLWVFWATEMDVTIIGLQNAGKTTLCRVLAVSLPFSLLLLMPRNPDGIAAIHP
jgi:hypothetical protein